MQSSCRASAGQDPLVLSARVLAPLLSTPLEAAVCAMRELWYRQGHRRKRRQTLFAVWDTRLSSRGPILCPMLLLWRQAQ